MVDPFKRLGVWTLIPRKLATSAIGGGVRRCWEDEED
jgi:hypothetical protein